MELIINIPEDRYKDVIEAQKHHLLDSYAQAVANGIPLEQIRNEIVEEQSCWREDADAEWHECRRILRIINKYMK